MLVDEFLRLFDAKSELEGFLPQREPGVQEHFVGISGAVSDGEYTDGGADGA